MFPMRYPPKKFLYHDNCPYQLGNKFPKETILNIWTNEKYFSDFLIYQLFGYILAKICLTSSYKIVLH